MKRLARGLGHKLGLRVAAWLSVFAVVAGILTFVFVFRYQMQQTLNLQSQLVATVRAQAEVAAFTDNEAIAQEVIEGLLANTLLRAVRIDSKKSFHLEGGTGKILAKAPDVTTYALLSPVDHKTEIGHLHIAINHNALTKQVMTSTMLLLMVIGLQVVLAASLIVWASRKVVIGPIVALADQMAVIEPGSGRRIEPDPNNADDEIGQLSQSANILIAAHEQAVVALRELATIDALTGVFNRRHFIKCMEDELARAKRADPMQSAVLMLDIDHFKRVNDTWGHAAGDSALRHLGTILLSNVRKIDKIGRLGGEEFAILLVGTGVAEGEQFAERLRQMVADTPVVHEAKLIQMTLSIGVALMQATDTEAVAALARADYALYAAKEQGRNRVVTVELPAEMSI